MHYKSIIAPAKLEMLTPEVVRLEKLALLSFLVNLLLTGQESLNSLHWLLRDTYGQDCGDEVMSCIITKLDEYEF